MIGFSPVSATIGGALIGVGAGLLWIVNGRIAGCSNIFGSLLLGARADLAWRLLFLIGLPIGAGLGVAFGPRFFADMISTLPHIDMSPPLLAIAGMLVGVGTALARGCTSGHGVFGLANLSLRSILAVGIFMATAILTVLFARQWP